MGLFDFLKPSSSTWKSKDEWKSARAVLEITDQQELARIVKESPHCKTRLNAVHKLDKQHQEVFADIANNDKEWVVRKAAIAMMNKPYSQTVYADIAKNHSEWTERKAAIKNLNKEHQKLFADIAKNDKEISVRIAAVQKMDKQYQQTYYADIAKNIPCDIVEDNYETSPYRKHVHNRDEVDKLTNQTLLADVAKNAKNSIIRVAAINKLDEQHQTLFVDIAKNDKRSLVREAAIAKLDEQHDVLLADIAKNDNYFYHSDEPSYYITAPEGKFAVLKLSDQILLADIAKNAKSGAVREAAEKKLTNIKTDR